RTDLFFKKEILPTLDTKKESTLELFRNLLIEKRFSDGNVILNATQHILEPQLQALKQSLPISENDLDVFLKELNELAPSSSLAKDDYLEKIAWDLELEDGHLLDKIENGKSYNWRKINPTAV